MDILQLCKLTNLLTVYVFCTGYYASGRLYSPGKSGDPGLRRKDEKPKAESYISKLWQGAMSRQIPEESKSFVMTPKGNKKGPAVIKILPEKFSKHPLTILSSGLDDDPMDLSSSNGKIFNIPDPLNGQISVLKSPGHTSSIIVSSRGGSSFNRGNKSFKKKLKNVQKKIAVQNGNNADMMNRNGYIGTFTGFLAETLCPLCRRLSNRRLRISCLLRYCIENPNISNGNPR